MSVGLTVWLALINSRLTWVIVVSSKTHAYTIRTISFPGQEISERLVIVLDSEDGLWIPAPLRSRHVSLWPEASIRHLILYQHQAPGPMPWIRTTWWWWRWGYFSIIPLFVLSFSTIDLPPDILASNFVFVSLALSLSSFNALCMYKYLIFYFLSNFLVKVLFEMGITSYFDL